MRRALVAATAALLLAGCETTYKQVPTITAAEGPSAVRFANGNALMLSEGVHGTVWLRPIRYYSGKKIFFQIVAFNHTTGPINFGTEDIFLETGDGIRMRAQEWDELQHYAHKRNPFGRWGDDMAEQLTEWHLAQVARRTPDQAVIWVSGDHQYFASNQAVQYQLEDAIMTYSMRTLQTTTIDPYTSYGGVVYAEQPDVPIGGQREILINVRFAGEDHHFRLRVAQEGTPTPVQSGLPAVPRQQIEANREQCATWLFDHPDLPCHYAGPLP